jgi:hypothetical protein
MTPTSRTRLLRGGGLAAAVGAGALAGALLFTPVASLAQGTPSPEATTSTPAPDDRKDDRSCPFGGGHGGLSEAAEALGISGDELHDALVEGKSIATIAEERGVELQTVVDAMVNTGTERIDAALADGRIDEDRAAELKAELADRIDEFVQQTDWPGWRDHDRWSGHGWRDGHGWWGGFDGPDGLGGLDAVAESLGLDEGALWDALRDGQSIADVAAEQGVDLQAVQDALVSAATERVDAALADGRIDDDRAAELKAELPDLVTDFVQQSLPSWQGRWEDHDDD